MPPRAILRRDFLNNVLLGAGAGLLGMPAPAAAADRYTGYAGVGDYARSNGDPWPVVAAGHRLRDSRYQAANAIDTGERFDLIIAGGGLSGLGAAYYYHKAAGASRRCLILENHAMFGGHCKQNEFLVNGRSLVPANVENRAVTGRLNARKNAQWMERRCSISRGKSVFPGNSRCNPASNSTARARSFSRAYAIASRIRAKGAR